MRLIRLYRNKYSTRWII